MEAYKSVSLPSELPRCRRLLGEKEEEKGLKRHKRRSGT